MAATVPCAEPSRLTAGNTWQWTRRFVTYPVSEGWSLRYAINGADSLNWLDVWVTDDGAEFTILVPASATELTPGRYEWTALVEGSGIYLDQRYTAARGVFVIEPNPTEQEPGDRQPFAEKALAVIEAFILAGAPAGIQSYSLGNRSFQFTGMDQALSMRAAFRTELFTLRNPGKALPGQRLVFTRAT